MYVLSEAICGQWTGLWVCAPQWQLFISCERKGSLLDVTALHMAIGHGR